MTPRTHIITIVAGLENVVTHIVLNLCAGGFLLASFFWFSFHFHFHFRCEWDCCKTPAAAVVATAASATTSYSWCVHWHHCMRTLIYLHFDQMFQCNIHDLFFTWKYRINYDQMRFLSLSLSLSLRQRSLCLSVYTHRFKSIYIHFWLTLR